MMACVFTIFYTVEAVSVLFCTIFFAIFLDHLSLICTTSGLVHCDQVLFHL